VITVAVEGYSAFGANARAIAAERHLLETVSTPTYSREAAEISGESATAQSSQKPEIKKLEVAPIRPEAFQSLPRALFGRYNVSIP